VHKPRVAIIMCIMPLNCVLWMCICIYHTQTHAHGKCFDVRRPTDRLASRGSSCAWPIIRLPRRQFRLLVTKTDTKQVLCFFGRGTHFIISPAACGIAYGTPWQSCVVSAVPKICSDTRFRKISRPNDASFIQGLFANIRCGARSATRHQAPRPFRKFNATVCVV
jgi:hypothetical protein